MRILTAVLGSLVVATASSAQPVPATKQPCTFPSPRAIACNTSNDTGVLQFTDCSFFSNSQAYNYDYWTFNGTAGQFVEIYAETSESLFKPRVAAYRPDGSLAGIGEDYQFDPGTDLLPGALEASGQWTIMVTAESPIFSSKDYYLQLNCSTVVPPTAPAAPTNLSAAPVSTTEIALAWSDNATNEDDYRLEIRSAGGQYVDIGSVPFNTVSVNIVQLNPGSSYSFRVRARRSSAYSAYSNEASATTLPEVASCVAADTVLCVDDIPGDRRFEVKVQYQTSQSGGLSGSGHALSLGSIGVGRGGLFWFFGPDNPELLVKILNACTSGNPRFWVFFSAGTNLGFSLSVRDTHTGIVKVYTNPDLTSALPVQDTGSSPFVCE